MYILKPERPGNGDYVGKFNKSLSLTVQIINNTPTIFLLVLGLLFCS